MATIIKTPFGDAVAKLTTYFDGTLAVTLEDPVTGEPIATVSINLSDRPDAPLCEGEFHAKTYSENETLRKPLLECGLFEDTGLRVRLNAFGTDAEVWRIKDWNGSYGFL